MVHKLPSVKVDVVRVASSHFRVGNTTPLIAQYYRIKVIAGTSVKNQTVVNTDFMVQQKM